MAINTQGLGKVSAILSEITTQQGRESLDVRLTFIPFNLSALTVSLGNKFNFTDPSLLAEFTEEVAKAEKITDPKWKKERLAKLNSEYLFSLEDLSKRIKEFLSSTHKNSVSITGTQIQTLSGTSLNEVELFNLTPCIVYQGGTETKNIIGAFYKSYDTARHTLFKNYLNKLFAKFIKDEFYQDRNYTKGFDVGHIIGGVGTEADLTNTAIGERVRLIYQTLDNLVNQGIATDAQRQIAISRIQPVLDDLKKQSTYGPQVLATLTQDTKTALLSVKALVLIVQERVENQYEYGNRIESDIAARLSTVLFELGFSKSLKQHIALIVEETARFGKVLTKGQKKPPVVIKIDAKPNQAKSKFSTGIKATGRTASKVSKKPLPALKSKPVQQTLTNLQNLLNTLLHEQIRQNMGTGNRRDVLNYRTGRFAQSATVERISQGREGMITAYYTYMKYPYATFSEGGRQQFPRSRDPKLLISKSIREIMQQQMITRMRAQLI